MAGSDALASMVPSLPQPGQMQPDQGGGLSRIMGLIANYHQAKQNQAIQTLSAADAAVAHGFIPSAKGIIKAYKTLGVDLASGHELDQALTQGTQQPRQSQGQPNKTLQTPPGEGTAQDPNADKYDPKKIASIADVGKRQQAQLELQVDGMIRQAVQRQALQGATQESILNFTKDLTDLKDSVANDKNMNALGRIAMLSGNEINIDASKFAAMNPKQQQQSLDALAGNETQAQKASRDANMTQFLIAKGTFKDPEAAGKYVAAMDAGLPPPKEVTDQMITHPLSDLTDIFTAMDTGAKMGMTGDQLSKFGQNYATLGMSAMPTGWQNLYIEANKARQEEAKAAQTSAGAEASRAGTESAALKGYDIKQDGKTVHVQGEAETKQVETYGYTRTDEKGQPVHIPGTLEATMLERKAQMAKVEAVLSTTEGKEIMDGYRGAAIAAKLSPSKAAFDNLSFWEDKMVKEAGGTVDKKTVHGWFTSSDISSYSWPADVTTPGSAD